MLNYAYAVKLAHLQIHAIGDGYDPTFGIMHNGKRGNPAPILDFIEPERPKIDAAILKFAQSSKFAAADFAIRCDGVCRLSPQLVPWSRDNRLNSLACALTATLKDILRLSKWNRLCKRDRDTAEWGCAKPC